MIAKTWPPERAKRSRDIIGVFYKARARMLCPYGRRMWLVERITQEAVKLSSCSKEGLLAIIPSEKMKRWKGHTYS